MSQTTLWVSTQAGRALFKVTGKGSFQNAGILKDAARKAMDNGAKSLDFDLAECTGMDSTFLGTLASLAMRLKQQQGSIALAGVQGRNKELVENMGLDKLVAVAETPADPAGFGEPVPVDGQPGGKKVINQTMLDAHKTLIAIDARNEPKFKDVVKLLEQEAGEDTKPGA